MAFNMILPIDKIIEEINITNINISHIIVSLIKNIL
jgi:hypothetical protein